MELFELKNDVRAFGFQVKSFPQGIGEAFDTLIAMVSEGLNRSYYGISWMDDQGQPMYIAAVEEKNEGEAEKNKCERYIIEKGKYSVVTLMDWRQKTETIKDIFHQMMDQPHIDHTKPCIEWYKNDDEMLCMLKVNLHELSESSA
jgi:predicted transcriptional regulator YdeE